MSVKMRRYVALLLFVALLMAMAACGANEGPAQPGAASTRTPIVQKETPTLLLSPRHFLEPEGKRPAAVVTTQEQALPQPARVAVAFDIA